MLMSYDKEQPGMIWAAFSYDDWEAIAASLEALTDTSFCNCQDHREEAEHLTSLANRIYDNLKATDE